MSTITNPTAVITVRGRDRAALLADPDFVYVGRRCAGWAASIWGNPYKVASARWGDPIRPNECPTAEDAVYRFSVWLARNPALLTRLPELHGKTLGCWCGNWRPGEPEIACHAVVLARMADAEVATR